METMTPAQLGIILAATALVLIGRWLFESRASWLPWVAAIWQRYFYVRLPQSPDELSSVSQAADSEIMSNSDEAALSEASRPRTDDFADGQTDGRTPPAPTPQPVTLDTAKSLRAHGYTRDEARALLKTMDRTLGNDTWAQAKPADPIPDDTIVTPYAGRVTKRSYYPEQPDLEFQECKE
jgi:hypothetical protein